MSLDRVDPECRPALEAFREWANGMDDLPLPERRSMVSALESQLAAGISVSEHVETEDRTIPGPVGGPDIAIRIYRPSSTAPNASARATSAVSDRPPRGEGSRRDDLADGE